MVENSLQLVCVKCGKSLFDYTVEGKTQHSDSVFVNLLTCQNRKCKLIHIFQPGLTKKLYKNLKKHG